MSRSHLFNLDSSLGPKKRGLLLSPFKLNGWFIDKAGLPAKQIRVRINNRLVVCHSRERRDVAYRMPNQGRDTQNFDVGFYADIESGRGLKYIRVEAVCNDGSIIFLQSRLCWIRPRIPGLCNLESSFGTKNFQVLENPFKLSGWFIDNKNAPAQRIQVRVGKNVILCRQTERSDVFSYFKKNGRNLESLNVGFFAEVKTGVGLKFIKIEVVCADGTTAILKEGLRWMPPYQPSSLFPPIPGDSLIIPTEPDKNWAPTPKVRAIVFYLPQFHAIPENNKWWGEGFTEWTNVRPAKPQFEGHYQPHVPHPDLGYYDLSDADVMEKQAQMARSVGIYGFCFYYYWFAGKKLLEMPLERMLESGRPNMPFCYCWANENWSRRWDGRDTELLIEQKYSPQDDEQVIRDLIRAFRDSRYIRVDGKPILLVYRPKLLPDPVATFKLWREICRSESIGEIHLAGVKGFGCNNAADMGLDALVEFPPNDIGATQLSDKRAGVVPAPDFNGKLFEYREVRHKCIESNSLTKPLYRGVMPSWDNTARRKNKAGVFLNSSPSAYLHWLDKTVSSTYVDHTPEHRLLFINAWNEWAEGCHLEPDQKYGYAWLNATRRALGSWSDTGKSVDLNNAPVLLLAHDAVNAGSQVVLLSLLRAWHSSRQFPPMQLICVRGGELLTRYQELCPTIVLSDYSTPEKRKEALDQFLSVKPCAILANTVLHGPLLEELSYLNAPVVTYCHELQKSIERWAPGAVMEATLRNSTHFLAASETIAENLQKRHQVTSQSITVVPASIIIWSGEDIPSKTKIASLKAELGITPDDIVVFGAGSTDWRKGPDIFLQVAEKACAIDPRLKFFWVGGDSAYLAKNQNRTDLKGRIRFLGTRPSARVYFYAGDIFALTSREDPCPLVALEAADAGLPVICFEGSGDIPRVLGPTAGAVVPHEDAEMFCSVLLNLAHDPHARQTTGMEGRSRVRNGHDTKGAASEVAKLLMQQGKINHPPLVSVIIPNYNHAPYLPLRLESVRRQTLTNIEIILLDDASTDSSRDILAQFSDQEPRVRYEPNTVNSGSTFKQWRKGLKAAKGKYIWIAESDDAAEFDLLERLVTHLESDPEVTLACCQLRMMNTDGGLGGTPDEWLGELDPVRWKSSYINDGRDEIARYLSQKNTILNASGVVFRNFSRIEELVDDSMRLCADWLFWVRLLNRGKIAYEAAPLNYWRLQSSNARTRPPGELELQEGIRIIDEIAEVCSASAPQRRAMLEQFTAKCDAWRKKATTQALAEE